MPAEPTTVVNALKHRYIKSKGPDATATVDEIIAFLRDIDENRLHGNPTLISLMAESHAEWIISDEDKSVINSVDDCSKIIFKLIDVEAEINQQLRRMIPEVACQLLKKPDLPLSISEYTLFEVLDLLVSACVGWAPGLGRSGENFYKKVNEVVDSLQQGENDYKRIETDLQNFLNKEQERILKVEKRLIASETGFLRSARSKTHSAQMLNRAMEDKQLTQPIIDFLLGPWYNSLQLLALKTGFDGEDWSRAVKLTKTLIWTYQPIQSEDKELENREKQRLYRIIENIPDEVRDLLIAFEQQSDNTNHALEELESEHVQVVSGLPLEYVSFTPIETGEEVFNQKTSVSRILLRKVKNLNPGQWFTFEENNVCIRIKMILKLDDIKYVLMTNRNGVKALEKSFDELAYYLSAGVIKPLSHEDIFSSTFATYYHGLVEKYEQHVKHPADQPTDETREEVAFEDLTRDEVTREETTREQIASKELTREEARRKSIARQAAMARSRLEAERTRHKENRQNLLTRARLEASKPANLEKVIELTVTVSSLNVGAWLKLPDADGLLSECKLAVKLTATNKMIFVSRAGMRMGEYSIEELVQILVAGEGEIEKGGLEFEDTLEKVVTKLRKDRDKSYDDLTGS